MRGMLSKLFLSSMFILGTGCSSPKNNISSGFRGQISWDNQKDSDIVVPKSEFVLVKYHSDEVDVRDMVPCPLYSSDSGFVSENIFRDIDFVEGISSQDYNEVIKAIEMPIQAAIYCARSLIHGGNKFDVFNHGVNDYWSCFAEVHERKVDDCDGIAIASAALLSDNGFKPYVLHIRDSVQGHLLYVYLTRDGKLGSIGNTPLEYLSPRHDTLEELVNEYNSRNKTSFTNPRVFLLKEGYIDNMQNNIVRY